MDTTEIYDKLLQRFRSDNLPLEVDFRKLVNWVRLGDQLTHQIHPYPAKLLPHIAHFFCRSKKLAPEGSAILDPFCGSGTVALEASIAGHSALVADANPLALLITSVKTRPYKTKILSDALESVCSRAKRFRVAPKVEFKNDDYWYSLDKKLELEIVLRAVNEIEDEHTRDFFRLCFSVVARRLSCTDLTISVPVRLKAQSGRSKASQKAIRDRLAWIKSANCVEEFRRVCQSNIQRIDAANIANPQRREANVIGPDARSVSNKLTDAGVPNPELRLALTSPPYGSAQKYVRASSMSLNWLGYGADSGIAKLESESIGREHVYRSKYLELEPNLPQSFEDDLAMVGRSNPRRERITRIFLHEFRDSLIDIARCIPKEGRFVLVTGNNVVSGIPLRNDYFSKEILEREGLVPELEMVDDIKSRGLMTKRNKTASVISRESVIVFKRA